MRKKLLVILLLLVVLIVLVVTRCGGKKDQQNDPADGQGFAQQSGAAGLPRGAEARRGDGDGERRYAARGRAER